MWASAIAVKAINNVLRCLYADVSGFQQQLVLFAVCFACMYIFFCVFFSSNDLN